MIDWLAYSIVRTFERLLCWLPPYWVVKFGAGVGFLSSYLQPKRVRIGWNNVRAAYQGLMDEREAKRVVRGCFATMGACVVETMRMPAIDKAYVEKHIQIRNQEYFERLAGKGRPLVLLTGHYGNWEMMGIVTAVLGYPVMAVARLQNRMPKLYGHLIALRESRGNTIIHKGGAMRQLLDGMEAGRLVAIVGDQASKQGRYCSFFGRRALFASGPYHLAYTKKAFILPAFIHRTEGADQVIHIEEPFELSQYATEAEAVEAGIQRFSDLLARHIKAAPSNWLWMHKRWKHTPDRRILILSDKKPGHFKQSKVVAELLSEGQSATVQVQEVEMRHRLGRFLVAASAAIAPKSGLARAVLRWGIKPEHSHRLFKQYADVVISCGSLTNAVNVIWSAPFKNRMITLMNPKPIRESALDVVIAPKHDGVSLKKKKCVQIQGALMNGSPESYAQAGLRLKEHPNFKPGTEHYLAVCLGGDTANYQLTLDAVRRSVEAVLGCCRRTDSRLLLTTSRRTAPEISDWLKTYLTDAPECALLVIASEDTTPQTIEGMFGLAEKVVVTGESISMVTEACAAHKPTWVFMPNVRVKQRSSRKHERFIDDLAREGFIRLVQVTDLEAALMQSWQPPHALDNAGVVRAALEGVL